jgi:hypothetical protein
VVVALAITQQFTVGELDKHDAGGPAAGQDGLGAVTANTPCHHWPPLDFAGAVNEHRGKRTGDDGLTLDKIGRVHDAYNVTTLVDKPDAFAALPFDSLSGSGKGDVEEFVAVLNP